MFGVLSEDYIYFRHSPCPTNNRGVNHYCVVSDDFFTMSISVLPGRGVPRPYFSSIITNRWLIINRLLSG